jgi:ribosomal protein L11 methyltransferase
MYSLRLTCAPAEVDAISGELWEAGTAGIRELDCDGITMLIAGFETNEHAGELFERLSAFSPEWQHEAAIDWIEQTHSAWPPREVGDRLFLAAPWRPELTPPGRVRVIHNPGTACGTGEHPCSQLALMALERNVDPGFSVIDIGTGSGILTIAALRLGARIAIGIDTDEAALPAARENFHLNGLTPLLVAGTTDCLPNACADITVANINGSVLLSMGDELLRITQTGGKLILTGFTESELHRIQQTFGSREILAINEWRCLVRTIS